MITLRQRLKDVDPKLYQAFERSEEIAWNEWIPALSVTKDSYNSYPHIRNLENHLDSIMYGCEESKGSNFTVRFSPAEIYLILSSILFHDIGRIRRSDGHGKSSEDIIKDNWAHLGIASYELAISLGKICRFHDEKPEKMQKEERKLYNVVIDPYGEVRERSLAALLTFVDHMDSASTRVMPRYLKSSEDVKVVGAFRRVIRGVYVDYSARMVRTVISSRMPSPRSKDDYAKLSYSFDRKEEWKKKEVNFEDEFKKELKEKKRENQENLLKYLESLKGSEIKNASDFEKEFKCVLEWEDEDFEDKLSQWCKDKPDAGKKSSKVCIADSLKGFIPDFISECDINKENQGIKEIACKYYNKIFDGKLDNASFLRVLKYIVEMHRTILNVLDSMEKSVLCKNGELDAGKLAEYTNFFKEFEKLFKFVETEIDQQEIFEGVIKHFIGVKNGINKYELLTKFLQRLGEGDGAGQEKKLFDGLGNSDSKGSKEYEKIFNTKFPLFKQVCVDDDLTPTQWLISRQMFKGNKIENKINEFSGWREIDILAMVIGNIRENVEALRAVRNNLSAIGIPVHAWLIDHEEHLYNEFGQETFEPVFYKDYLQQVAKCMWQLSTKIFGVACFTYENLAALAREPDVQKIKMAARRIAIVTSRTKIEIGENDSLSPIWVGDYEWKWNIKRYENSSKGCGFKSLEDVLNIIKELGEPI